MLRALSHLLECGISVAKLRESLASIRHRHPDITRTSVPARYLVITRDRVYFRSPDKALEEISSGQLAFTFVVELRKVRDEVRQKERQLGKAAG